MAVVVPTLGLGLLLADRSAASQRELVDQQLSLAADALARDVELLIDAQVTAAESLAGQLELEPEGPFDAAALEARLARFRERQAGLAVAYVGGPDGRSFVADPALQPDGSPTAPRDYSDRAYYQQLVRTHSTVISPVQLGKSTRIPNVHVAVPILSHGVLRAFLCVSIDLGALQSAVDRISSSVPGGRMLVADQSSRAVAHADPSARAEMRNLRATPLFRVGGDALRTGDDDRGVPSRAAQRAVTARGLGWSVAAYLPLADLERAAAAARWRTIGAAAVTLLLCLVVCAALAARLARPIREVSQAARQLGAGQFDVKLVSRGSDPVEVTQLFEAMTSMAAERRRLEGEVRLRADQLSVANTELAKNLAALREAQIRAALADRLASVGTLAAGVAHEINNPTAYVRTNVRYVIDQLTALSDTLGGDPRGECLAEMIQALLEAEEGTDRVRRIVSDLKIFSRNDASEQNEVFALQPVIESALAVSFNELRHKATLERDYHPVGKVRGASARLAQVVLNLVMNAVQAVGEGGAQANRIRVGLREEGGEAVIEVEDSGCGILAENLSRIFDPFFTTKPVGQGTGLGLAVSRGIVMAMGGQITVESEPGRGSTFRVRLPLHREAADFAKRAAAHARPSPRRGRVLVIDDEESIRSAIRRVLGSSNDVSLACGAAPALELLRAGQRFDVILCDVMMPDRSGFDLFQEVSRDFPQQAEKMVFVTGGAFDRQGRDLLATSGRPSLEKPFVPSDLRALVARAVLDEATAAEATTH